MGGDRPHGRAAEAHRPELEEVVRQRQHRLRAAQQQIERRLRVLELKARALAALVRDCVIAEERQARVRRDVRELVDAARRRGQAIEVLTGAALQPELSERFAATVSRFALPTRSP